MAITVNEQALDERLALLEKARNWGPRLISKLESHIRTADDRALYRINPFTFAKEKNVAETEVIDLFLHATALGLFSMDWNLFCPKCCCVVDSFRSLRGVHNHYHCAFCATDYEVALDEYIAIAFTISPEIRTISFHDPLKLSAFEYFFQVRNTPDGVLPDGVPLITVKGTLARAVSWIPAGQTTTMEVDAAEGSLLGACPNSKACFLISIDGAPASTAQAVSIPYGEVTPTYAMHQAAPGKVVVNIQNTTAELGLVCIAQLPPGFDINTIPLKFVPFLNGKRLLTTQTFRDLFRSEVIKASEGIDVKDITLLFTDLKGSTELYERIGDLNAFSLVQRHFERLLDVTVRNNGAIIKTIGDAVMASFLKPADAVKAAIAMRNEIAASNADQPGRALILKIGIHTGAAIAVTLNDRLDYFGQNVNIAARIQGIAEAGEICISGDVHADEDAAALLATLPVQSSSSKLRGMLDDFRILRIGSDTAPVAPTPAE
jgi:class 3 adenylate cyclase